ncbi:MAG: hypothetical protein ACSHX8_01290 [Opitutaceae bacterium]
MKTLLIPALLLTLLLGACSKPKEEKASEQDVPTKAIEAETTKVAAPAATEVEAEEATSEKVDYTPSLHKTITGAENIVALEKLVQTAQPISDNRNKLLAEISAETDPAKLSELKAELALVEQAFNEQNDQLIQKYDIDLNSENEYLLVTEKSEVSVKLEDSSDSSDAEGYVATKTLEGSELIQKFRNDLVQVSKFLEYIAQLNQALSTATDETAQAELTTQIAEAKAQHVEINQVLLDTYGFTFERPSKITDTELKIYTQPPLPKLNDLPGMPNDHIYIGQLEGIDTNLEFERNLQIMEAARQRASSLVQNISAEIDEAKKAELQKEFDAQIAKLNEDNKTMIDTYKYSIDRNYSQVVTKARLYVKLTEDEIAAQKEKKPDYTAPEDGFEQIITINGVDQNLAFQRDTEMMQLVRQRIIQAKQALEVETDAAKKTEIQEFIDQMVEQITAANKTMIETYKYSINREYQYIVENSDIYLQLTREEISNL